MSQVTFAVITKTVAAAATPEKMIATATRISGLVFSAPSTNTGNVFYQTSAVATTDRIPIPPGATLPISFGTFDWIDGSTIYLDAAVNGEGVQISYIKGKR